MRHLGFLAALLALAACASSGRAVAPETLLSGTTMGSAWTVKVVGSLPLPADQLRAQIQSRFAAVDQGLSTYRADSALSRFNADDSGEWREVDAELVAVMVYALSLAEASDGAYDVTVGPLVNLWGFGPDPANYRAPEAGAIERARAHVGWRKVEVDLAGNRARKQPGVRVDLSSLGKGRGVDRVAEYLDSKGVHDYLIDLSGKLRARGHNRHGRAWRVAVEQPLPDVSSSAPAASSELVALHDASIATAGDYRRFFESDGHHYSHIIDPRTGAPVTHDTVSATALLDSCMEADAWATAFMVMPADDAVALADSRGLRALMIERSGSGFRLRPSAAWRNAATPK